MARYIFDTETDGFLEVLTKIHSLVLQDADTGVVWSCHKNRGGGESLEEGLALLAEADEIIGHNIIAFDVPAIQKVYPKWKPRGIVTDTIILAKLVVHRDELKETDFGHMRKGTLPSKLIGSYSLKAFGLRMGILKGDFEGPWDTWTPQMQHYCEQDVVVTAALYAKLIAKGIPENAAKLEMRVKHIIERQRRFGFQFNSAKAAKLYALLSQRRLELETQLRAVFKPRYRRDGGLKASSFTPKKDVKARGYVGGCGLTKVKLVQFNPSSRDHIEHWLKAWFGWEPVEFTDDGGAKIDDEIIRRLPWPEAKLLGEYLMVQKRIGQLAEGKQAWLAKVHPNGRTHCAVDTMGAGTFRMTHFDFNTAQVPGLTDRKTGGVMPYGKECRELFEAPEGKVLVGCDADALELRDLSGYMARYDGGAYIKTILEGKKSEGTDMHSVNMRALKFAGRDPAKTWFYAWIYGAGDEKLGIIAGEPKGAAAKARGKRDKQSFLKNLPAIGKLMDAIKEIVGHREQRVRGKLKKAGFITGPAGHRVPIRSMHSALNTLLQHAGAIQMKQALVILDEDLQAAGLQPGKDYEFVANIHDEWQIETFPERAAFIGTTAEEAIRKAGEHFKFACPLKGNHSVGQTWADTH